MLMWIRSSDGVSNTELITYYQYCTITNETVDERMICSKIRDYSFRLINGIVAPQTLTSCEYEKCGKLTSTFRLYAWKHDEV